MGLGVFNRIGDGFKIPEERAAKQANDAELDKIEMAGCLAAVDAVIPYSTCPPTSTYRRADGTIRSSL
jgi:hypothetical protein